jgi:hypothetical protein
MGQGFRADGMPQGGRRAGARNKLSTKFLEALAADFEEGGADAIKLCRIESPEKYVQIVASILPKELDVTHNQPGELDDDELAALLQHVRELRARVVEHRPEWIPAEEPNGWGRGFESFARSKTSIT